MVRYRCLSCDGIYGAESADGLAYYHACPPDHVLEVGAPGSGIVERMPIADPRDENAELEMDTGLARVKHEGKGRTEVAVE